MPTAALATSPDQPFQFVEFELDSPRADEVLVRLVACGVCHTDISIKAQSVALPLPMVLGHEGSGVVEAVGSAIRHVKPGDHVVLSGDSCGICKKCERSLPSYCDEFVERNLTGYRVDGTSPASFDGNPLRTRFTGQSAFATHTVVSGRSVVPIDKTLPLELMGPLGCGLMTGAGTVINALKPAAGSSIAVFGAGTVGLAAVMGATLSGCGEIIAIDTQAERLAIAAELGATRTLQVPASDDHSALVNEILSLTGGGADFAVECSGHPAAISDALASLGRPGLCAQVGAPPDGTALNLEIGPIGFGRGIRGVVLGEANPQTFIPYLAKLFAHGKLPFEQLVRWYPFADLDQVFTHCNAPGAPIKPIVRIS